MKYKLAHSSLDAGVRLLLDNYWFGPPGEKEKIDTDTRTVVAEIVDAVIDEQEKVFTANSGFRRTFTTPDVNP